MNYEVKTKRTFNLELSQDEFEALRQAVYYAVHRAHKHPKSGIYKAPCRIETLEWLKDEFLEV